VIPFILPLVAPFLAGQQTAPTIPVSDEIVELTPFEVTAESDPYAASKSVSATRFASEILQTPASIQVLTEQFMDDIGAVGIEDVFAYATSVTYDQQGSQEATGGTSYNVRGFKAPETRVNGFRGGGIYINRAIMDRLEIARGPQAVLYGQGSAGGTANTITKAPLFKAKNKFRVMFGSYRFQQYDLDLGGPVTSNLAYRLVTQYHYSERLNDWHFREDTVIYPAITWKAGSRVVANARYNYLNRNTNRLNAPYTALDYGLQSYYPTPTGVAPADFDSEQRGRYYAKEMGREVNLAGPFSYYNYNINSASGDVTIRITGNLTYRGSAQYANTGRVSHDRVGENQNYKRTASSGAVAMRERYRDFDNEDTEMRHDLLFDLKRESFGLKVLLGFEKAWLNYDRLEVETLQNSGKVVPITDIYGDKLDKLWASTGWSVSRLISTNPNSPLIGSPTVGSMRLSAYPDAFVDGNGQYVRVLNGNPSEAKTISNACYATMMLDLFDNRLHLLGGVRYDDNDFTVTRQKPTLAREFDSSEDYHTEKTSWQAGATYDLFRGVSLYSTYSTTFVPNNETDRELKPLGPQTGHGVDAGIKTSLFNGRLTGSLVWFDTKRKGIPRSRLDMDTGISHRYISGKEQARGYEIEINYRPVKTLRIMLNATFLDGEILSNEEDARVEGWDLTDAPDEKVNLWATYKIPATFLKGLNIGFGLNYVSSAPLHGGRYADYWIRSDAYTIYGASLGYSFKLFGCRMYSWARIDNMFDKEYIPRRWAWGQERTVKGFLQVTF
jgi:iron complex outermembrane receptor protein